MRAESRNHLVHPSEFMKKDKKDFWVLIDSSIKPIAICCMFAGLAAAAAGKTTASEYLLAAGFLSYLASWFGDWWQK